MPNELPARIRLVGESSSLDGFFTFEDADEPGSAPITLDRQRLAALMDDGVLELIVDPPAQTLPARVRRRDDDDDDVPDTLRSAS